MVTQYMTLQWKRETDMSMRDNYIDGTCPDCDMLIPEDAENGSECVVCGHVFWEYCPYDGIDENYPTYEAMPHPMEDEFGNDIRRRLT